MTTKVTLEFDLDYPKDVVWDFISDHERRAESISVVEEYDVDGDGEVTWHLSLPIPFVNGTIPVETEEVGRDAPNNVRFKGTSSAMSILGEHSLEETESGCTVENTFAVDGSLPGVETFFKKNIESELEKLKGEMERDIEKSLVD